MRLAEVQRRVREIQGRQIDAVEAIRGGTGSAARVGLVINECRILYRDTLRTLLDHDLPDDARLLIEAALEAER